MSEIMRIRDISWRGQFSWPPHWNVANIEAEEGILIAVHLPNWTKSFLGIEVEHMGHRRMGVLLIDEAVQSRLCRTLKDNIGKPLVEIGDLQIAP